MAEPLLRLALEVKNNQGKPLKMVSLLLRAWFSDAELQVNQEKKGISADYKMAALSMDKEILISINNRIEEQINVGFESNNFEKVIAACSEIIDGSQTDETLLIQAIINRGLGYVQINEIEQGLRDCTTVIEMLDVHVELKAIGLYCRSVIYGENGEMELAIKDSITLINMQDAPKHLVSRALFYVSEKYFDLLQINKAQLSLKEAFKKGEQKSDHYSFCTIGILRSINQLGSSFWQEQIIWIIPLYAKHKVLYGLSTALILSITFFIKDESLMSSFKKWQQLWQKYGEKYQEMQLSLQVLQTSVLAVEQKNDKPLMSLPKEVRELVLPLLDKVLN